MVYDVLHVGRIEFLQDWHDGCAVGNGAYEGSNPRRCVLANECHLIGRLEPDALVEDVQLGNFGGKFAISW